MKTPFNLNQFLAVFKNYNETIFPLQIVFNLAAIFIIYFAFKPNHLSGRIISGVISFLWLWMGIVYHIIFFTSINKAAFLFGALFILQGILFLFFGVFNNRYSFEFNKDKFGIVGICLMLFALVIYPLLGYTLGHQYPSSPTFGLPCPTTIFTFGLLLINSKKVPNTIFIIPIIWSVIGSIAVFQFGMIEDIGLIIGCLIAYTLSQKRNKIFIKNEKDIDYQWAPKCR